MEILAINNFLKDYFEDYNARHSLQPHIIKAVRKIIKCRTEQLGGALFLCPNKHFHKFVFNSCKHRSCPSCNLINIENWLHKIKRGILNTNHYHVVFTIPDELNSFFLMNRILFTNFLFDASYQAISKMIKNEYNVTPGAISTLHTWSRTLTLHPHIHMLITDGGIDDNNHWIKSKQDWLVNVKGLAIIFRAKLLDLLHDFAYHNKLNLPKGFSRFKTHRLLRELRNKNWNVFITSNYDHPNGVATYLAKYIKGGPISNKRIIKFDKDFVSFKYFENNESSSPKSLTLTNDEFMNRILMHIPEKRQFTVRRYGIYANFKSLKLKELKLLFSDDLPANEYKPLNSKDFLISRNIFKEYCQCPHCHSELILAGRFKRDEFIIIKSNTKYVHYHKKKA